ncbi:MAG: hypothetical protein ACQEP3_00320 [Patescibacteria group bacterium]
MDPAVVNMTKVFVLGVISFGFTLLLTPAFTHFMYKHKLWKNKVRQKGIDGKQLKVFTKHHSDKETSVPRLGGLLVWIPPLILIFLFYGFSFLSNHFWVEKLSFLSRGQTWLPLFTLVVASLVGLVDDVLQIIEKPKNKALKFLFSKMERYIGGGLSLKYRISLVTLIGAVGSWWFYFRLGQDSIFIPGFGQFYLGLFFIPFFILVMLATYSGSVIDGLDGLSGGAFAAIFTAFTIIAIESGMINLAAFCLVLVGSILAFLWFNIPPARFYMGETGILGLTTTLTVIAFLTDSVAVLPIIAILLVAESGSVILQLLSKRFLNKKIFLSAPIHHHFEGKGWPSYKVTMRFWIIGVFAAIIGVVIRLMG